MTDKTDLGEVKTLAAAARLFFSQKGPRLIARHAIGSWALRAVLGPPSVTEIPVVGAVVVWWPIQEWLAHRYLLHWRPITIRGVRIDPIFARRHRAHHRAPHQMENTLLPIEVVRAAIPAGAIMAGLLSLGSVRRAATGMATYATMTLLYEWTHFLVHTGYRPKTARFRTIRRNHRLHHYHNERYWLGFTSPTIDSVLGTNPNPRSVKHSKTARALFGMAA